MVMDNCVVLFNSLFDKLLLFGLRRFIVWLLHFSMFGFLFS